MIILTQTASGADTITLANSTASSTLLVHASWVDWDGSTTFTPGRLNSPILTNGTTTVVTAPASGSYRTVKFLSIQNNYTAAVALTVTHVTTFAGQSNAVLLTVTLPVGYSLVYNDGVGWTTVGAGGQQIVTQQSGRLLKTTILATTSEFSISGQA